MKGRMTNTQRKNKQPSYSKDMKGKMMDKIMDMPKKGSGSKMMGMKKKS